MKVLILTDGKAGHENQSKAFARALGCDFDLMPVQFRSKTAKAFSYLLDKLGIRTEKLFSTAGGVPSSGHGYAAVTGTGSGTFYAAKVLARRLGVKCGVVLYPRGYATGSFDCILAPAFDRPPPAANVVEVPANLVAADPAYYADGVAAFKRHYRDTVGHDFDMARSAVAVIIGGPNKCSTMTPEWMRMQLDSVFAAHKADGENIPELWVTTSRRTPPDVEKVVASYPWDYRLLYSKDHFNPIPAFVSLAQTMYVTAESTGMLSEVCTFGSAEVHALDNLKPGRHKFRRFLEDLVHGGYVEGIKKIDLSAQFARARSLLGIASSSATHAGSGGTC